MGLHTPLYGAHVREGAKIVDFGGWDMPLHYGSQLEEHHAVRRNSGMFDVSHMGIVDLEGSSAATRAMLERLLANDVGRLRLPGQALYTCMLLPNGGIIDDLIVYWQDAGCFRLVVNAGTRAKDLSWIKAHAGTFNVAVREREELAMIAVQGPKARAHAIAQLAPDLRDAALALKPFCGAEFGAWFMARTGYTGEDGFEIMLPAAEAPALWECLRTQGVMPAGLGARDTLRLEAGMNLYGSDMDERNHPLESGLTWTVAFEPRSRDFIGRKALERLAEGGERKQVGLLLLDRGVLRSHQRVLLPAAAAAEGGGTGEVTSGTFSPTLGRSIALARVPRHARGELQVDIRGTLHAARIVKPPFVRHGKDLLSPQLTARSE